MLLAELEIFHSRPIAPTRRVALGCCMLPTDPSPGFGGILLGAVVAAHVADLDLDLQVELDDLLLEVGAGARISQPRLRHRLQTDHHGLARSRHRLLGGGDAISLDLDGKGSPASQVLGATYAVARVDPAHRHAVMSVIRRGLRWRGAVGPELLAHLAGAGGRIRSVAALAHPEQWALELLGFDVSASPLRREVQRRFRELLRDAHPDHGGARERAAQRIAELTEARRILLGPPVVAAAGR